MQAQPLRSSNTQNIPPVPRFPSVLLGALAVILILCACLGAGAYLYTTATHLVSEYRRHLNSTADRAQLFFDQRETLVRAIAATAVPAIEVAILVPTTQTLLPLAIPSSDAKNRYQLLLTRRHWKAIRRNGTLVFSSVDSTLTYKLATAEGQLRWQPQTPPLSLRLKPFNADLPDSQTTIVWLQQTDSLSLNLVAYTPLNRDNPESGWLGMEFSNIGNALTITPPPPNTTYSLFDTHRQSLLYSSNTAIAANLDCPPKDYFGFSDGWIPQYIILSKSLGTGGLRVCYVVPTSNLLRDGQTALLTAVTTLTMVIIVVLLGTQTIRRRLLLPARQQQQTLLDSVSLNQKLIAMAPIGLALVSRDGRVIFQKNSHATEWMDNDAQWHLRLPNQHERNLRTDVELADGRTLRIQAVALTYRDQYAALCSIIDVTAEKAEEASLRHAQHMAESANIAKTQFLTTMSHEIRTPLYGILGTLELMALSDTSTQHSAYMDTLRRSAETLFRVVGESLDLSRIEAGHMSLELREFIPQELVDSSISAFSAIAQQKGLLFYAIMPPTALTPVLGDAIKISQILNNLISNAIKFTLSGHVVIRLYLQAHDNHTVTLRFQVVDSGQGISADAIPKLFLPYFSNNDSHSDQPSTGLGLSICQHLAKLMEGSLTVVSEPGLGTSITFELTLAEVTLSTLALNRPALSLATLPVYVAGDVPEIITNLCQWLRHWGAYATPYDDQPATTGAILLRAWPCSSARIKQWTGRQVITLPAGSTPTLSPSPTLFHTLSTSIQDIGIAVRQAQTPTYSSELLPSSTATHEQKRHILVIDDNPINRQVLKEQLRIIGWTVHLETSAEAALDIPKLDCFEVILTDLFLPAMNGYELARTLRHRDYHGRIIGITANPIQDQEWVAAQMDAMLTKPLTMSTLRAHLPV